MPHEKDYTENHTKMTKKERKEIAQISMDFFKGFGNRFESINDAGLLVIDPLAVYLKSCGYQFMVNYLAENDKHPQVLFFIFKDGSSFYPSGKDLQGVIAKMDNWTWIIIEKEQMKFETYKQKTEIV